MRKALCIAVIASFTAAAGMANAQQCPSQCKSAARKDSHAYVNAHVSNVAEKSIVETAASVEDFSTLVAAVKAAGLVDALQGDGPFTVFAPTNAAFAKLPEGTVDTLLKPENRNQLVDILKYHVVSGKIMAGDVLKAMKVDTLQGSGANIGLTIEGANIVKTDIKCSNGVIHVIDAVITPKAK